MDLCIWIFVLFTLSSALQEPEDEESINDYLDEVLNNLKKNQELVSQFDPLRVPDYNENKLKLTDIVVRGLSLLHRSGDSTLKHEDGRIIAIAHLAVNDIHIDANYAAHVLFGWLRGEIAAIQSRVAARISISVDTETGVKKVEEFKVTEFGKVTIKKAKGIDMLEWLLKFIAQIIVNTNRQKIVEALEHNARDAIEKVIEVLDFPFRL